MTAVRDVLRRRWRGLTLRARVTGVTVLVLAVVLGFGGEMLLSFSREAMFGGVARESQKEAQALALQMQVTSSTPNLSVPGHLDLLADTRGHLLNRSKAGGARLAIPTPSQVARARAGERVVTTATATMTVPGPSDGTTVTRSIPLLIVGAPAMLHGRPVTVLVVAPIGDVLRAMTVLTVAIRVGVPLTVLLLGLAVWLVTGRTLRPVEALRRGADDIAHHLSERRLPVPTSRDEIHELAVTLNDMLDRLAAASASQRAFTADAAHELRSPLASARAQLEVALAHPDGTDWPATARGIVADIVRLSKLTDDLLALARLDSSRSDDDPATTTDLGALTAAVVERYDAARVPVDVRADGPVQVPVAAHDLDHVVRNLVDNAVRHATSRVVLDVTGDDGHGVVTVTDDGPGIPPADRARVFERFTRLDDARDRDAGGAGLGLAIVAETVHRYRGTVTLDDAGPGLRATVTLPLAS